MAETKKYKASVNITDFYYGVVGDGTTATTISHIKFLQEIGVEAPQEVAKAYGDGKVAEMAVAGGDVTVTTRFHAIPLEDKQVLFGLEESNGLYGMGAKDNPPLVGVVFAKEFVDGSIEYVGLPKGLFTRPAINGQSKEDGAPEFNSDEVEGQFMDRQVDGFADEKSVIFGRDEKGVTVIRDAIFEAIFGLPHPDAGTVTP